jgi:hypothetical protein
LRIDAITDSCTVQRRALDQLYGAKRRQQTDWQSQ